MKKKFRLMTAAERKTYVDNALIEAKNRMEKKAKTAKKARKKIAEKIAVSVAEFEALTGIMFSHYMQGKLSGILSISTSCLVNPACIARMNNKDSICAECFSVDTQEHYKQLSENTIFNYFALNEREYSLEELPYLATDILRIESFGDVGSVTQCINYINLCYKNPNTTVTAWSKNIGFWIIAFNRIGKPDNLIFGVSSEYKNVVKDIPAAWKKYIDFVFTVYTLDYLLSNSINPESFINCGGRSCRSCMRCYKKDSFKNGVMYVNELLKADAKKARKAGYNV